MFEVWITWEQGEPELYGRFTAWSAAHRCADAAARKYPHGRVYVKEPGLTHHIESPEQ